MMHVVAHDLRNPLFNIEITNNFIKDSLRDPLASERDARKLPLLMTAMIKESSVKALTLINDLLTLGDLQSNLRLEVSDLNEYLGTLMLYLQLHAQKKEIELYFEAKERPVYTQILS
jgi:two-component system, OmpR family, sensor histidine kinase VicK